MPENLSYDLIFTIMFYGILGLAVLGGLMRGFKKTLFNFITMLIFYIVFFLTIETVATALWSMEIPSLGTALAFIDQSLSSYTSFEAAFNPLMLSLLGIDLSTANASLTEFILGMGMFIVKIAYTLLYFTVGLVVYKILCMILKMLFIHNKKGESKNALFGALFGFANGVMAVAVMLIMMGGFMSVLESVSTLIPEDLDLTTLSETPDRDTLYEASYSLIPLADVENFSPQMVTDVVTAYNNNLIVQMASSITITDDYGLETPFNLYLFDSVASFTYKEEKVSIRQELVVVSSILDAVFQAMDDAGIELTELSGADMGVILSAAASLDLTMLLDSKLVSNALVFVLSGDAGIEISDMLIVPADIVWFDVLDDDGEIVTNGELRNILLALNALVDVAGMVDFTNFDLNVITALTDDVIDVLFNSRVLVATISDLLTTQDFGTTEVIIPDTVFDDDGYLLKTELKALASAVRLVVSEVVGEETEFDFAAALSLTSGQIDTLFESEILSATIGKFLYDMNTDPLVIPASVVSTVTMGINSYSVVTTVEMKAVMNAISIIGFSDFETMAFDATLIENFESTTVPGTLDDDKLNGLFDSAIIHATFSKMLLDLTSGVDAVVSIPYFDSDNVAVRTTVGTTQYVSKTELKNTLKAIYSLGFSDFDNLGSLDPESLFDNINAILASATLHATISEKLIELGSGILEIPTVDVDNVAVMISVGSGVTLTNYIKKTEITGILDGLSVLGIADIENFSGTIDLSVLVSEASQDKLLSSASLHYTISKTLIDLGSSILIIPDYTEDGAIEANRVKKTVSTYTYITKAELKALINAFNIMDFNDLDSFGTGIDSAKFFTNATTLLESATIQATLSDKMLNGTGNNLLVPNTERSIVGSITYVQSDEILAILNSLTLLGLTDFTALSFNPDNIFVLTNYDELFLSTSMQATISKPILAIAADETAALGTTTLIVPNALRETVAVGLTNPKQIELVELKALLTSLKTLGITSFAAGNFSATSITSKSDAQLTTMLSSGSVHVTFDNMMKANPSISIPELAQTDLLYGILNLTLANEIKYFILAANIGGGTDFTTITFNVNIVLSLNTLQRSTVATSMIVRNMLTPEFEDAVDVKNLLVNPDYILDAEDYEGNNVTTFLTYLDLLEIIKFLNDEAYTD